MYKIEFCKSNIKGNFAPKCGKPGMWATRLPISKTVYDRYSLVDITNIYNNSWIYHDYAYLIEERNKTEYNVDRRIIRKLEWDCDVRSEFCKDLFLAVGYYLDCENLFYDLLKEEDLSSAIFKAQNLIVGSKRSKYLDEFTGQIEPICSEYLFSMLIGSFDGMDNSLNALYDIMSDARMSYERLKPNYESIMHMKEEWIK